MAFPRKNIFFKLSSGKQGEDIIDASDVESLPQTVAINPDLPNTGTGFFKIMHRWTYPAATRILVTARVGLRNAAAGSSSVSIFVAKSDFSETYFSISNHAVTSNEIANVDLTRTATAFPTTDTDIILVAAHTGAVQAVLPDIYYGETIR